MIFNEEFEKILFNKLFDYLRERNSGFKLDNIDNLIKKCILRVYSWEILKIEYNSFITISGYDFNKIIGGVPVREIYERGIKKCKYEAEQTKKELGIETLVVSGIDNDLGWYIIHKFK